MSAPFQSDPARDGEAAAFFRLSTTGRSLPRLFAVALKSPAPRPDAVRSSTIGVEFAAIVGVFGWLGHLADDRLLGPDAFPVFLLTGIFAGLVGGILRMTRQLAPRRKDDEEAPDADRDRE